MMKTLYYFSIFTVSITAILIGIIAYMEFSPQKVFVIDNAMAIPVDKEVYRPGDRVVYTLNYCKYKNIPANVNRSLVNSVRISYTSYYTSLALGCGSVTLNDLMIPTYVDNGLYHIETSIVYELNPLRTLTVKWQSVEFKVEK